MPGQADDGLICGWHFTPGHAGRALGSMAEARELMQAPVGEGFVWLHMNLSHSASVRWLRVFAVQTHARTLPS